MNTLEAKLVKTCYGYDEFYWVIDGHPITAYLEQHRPESLSAFGSLSGLLPAWSWKLIRQWENDLVWNITKAGFSAWRPIRMKTGKTMAAALRWSHMEVRNIGNG